MIIDIILERHDDENSGIFAYRARDFYEAVTGYGKSGEHIARALDGGTEEDVKREVCAYLDANGYNPRIKDYVSARMWAEDDSTPRPLVPIL